MTTKIKIIVIFSFIIGIAYYLCNLNYSQNANNLQANPEQNNKHRMWDFISTKDVKAFDFIEKYPNYDGRKVIVAVMDTGVDMGVPGLLKTSEGKPKVIDAQDFSGEGDINLSLAEVQKDDEGIYLELPDKKRLRGIDRFKLNDNKLKFGIVSEGDKKNNPLRDLNDNGKNDDVYAVVMGELKENDKETVVIIDADGDFDLSDETPLVDYNKKLQSFLFKDPNNPEKRHLLYCSVNLFPSENKVVIHYDNGGHGTHVAGIATGYNLHGQETLNGIAPGAQVISLKIGNNRLAGGATTTESMKKALLYGVKYAKDHNVPLVFNISYGIYSVTAGKSELDAFIDNLLTENENIVICSSAGNNGPGLSTVGFPASSNKIIAVGAYLDKAYANNIYQIPLPYPIMYNFSSRGGDVAKPDIVAPGGASSSVPRWHNWDTMQGTSMASPQAAGCVALLMSGAVQENPPIDIKNSLIKRALKISAKPVEGYTHLDYGSGLIQVPEAFAQLKKFSESDEHNQILDYSITTLSPVYPDDTGTTAYWRTKNYFPHGQESQYFKIRPIFPKDKSPSDIDNFYRAYKLVPEADWMELAQDSVYIKGEKAADVCVHYDSSKLSNPGLYTAKVKAYRIDPQDNGKYGDLEFELWNTIIVPYTFHVNNCYTRKWKGTSLEIGKIRRYFLAVPPGATAMHIRTLVPPEQEGHVSFNIYNSKGSCGRAEINSYKDDTRESYTTINQKYLDSEIIEIIASANSDLRKESYYKLEVNFAGLKIEPEQLKIITNNPGNLPTGYFYLYNLYDCTLDVDMRGEVSGYHKNSRIEINNQDIYTSTFQMNNQIDSVYFEFDIGYENYNKCTDLSINIYNDANVIVSRSSFSNNKASIYLKNPDANNPNSKTYRVELFLAFTHANHRNWWLITDEYYYLRNTIKLNLKHNNKNKCTLYPGIPTYIDFSLSDNPFVTPNGYNLFGSIDIQNSNNFNSELEEKVFFKIE